MIDFHYLHELILHCYWSFFSHSSEQKKNINISWTVSTILLVCSRKKIVRKDTIKTTRETNTDRWDHGNDLDFCSSLLYFNLEKIYIRFSPAHSYAIHMSHAELTWQQRLCKQYHIIMVHENSRVSLNTFFVYYSPKIIIAFITLSRWEW